MRAKVARSPTRTPSASVSSRLVVPTSTCSWSIGIAFFASSGGRTWAGFAPVMPWTAPFVPWMREILVDHHPGVVEPDGRDADEALVLDVLDDEPQLVHVRAEHHGGRRRRSRGG